VLSRRDVGRPVLSVGPRKNLFSLSIHAGVENFSSRRENAMEFGGNERQQRFHVRRNKDFREVSFAPRNLLWRGVQEHDVVEIGHGAASLVNLIPGSQRDQNTVHQHARDRGKIGPRGNGEQQDAVIGAKGSHQAGLTSSPFVLPWITARASASVNS